MQTPTLAEPEAAAAVEEAAVEAAVEEAAVEAEEPPQAVRTPVAPTTAEAFRKSRREIIFIILFSFINAYHSISQNALVARFAVSVCIITILPTVRNRTNRQDYLPYFVSVPQYILLYPKIFLSSSTFFHICATSVQIYCVCAYFYQIGYKLFEPFRAGMQQFYRSAPNFYFPGNPGRLSFHFGNISLCIDGFLLTVVIYYIIIIVCYRRTAVSRPPSTLYFVIIGATSCPNLPNKI